MEKQLTATAKFTDLFKGTDLRRTFLCCAATTLHAATGINFLVGYATVFFQAAGESNAFLDSIILNSCGLAGALSAPFFARFLPRKWILIVGFTLTTLTMLIVGILYTTIPHNVTASKTLIAMVCIYEFAYSFSAGPLAWSIAAEMPAARLRSMTFGFAMTVGFVFAWLTTFTSKSPRQNSFELS